MSGQKITAAVLMVAGVACASIASKSSEEPEPKVGDPCVSGYISTGCGLALGVFSGTVVGVYPDGSRSPLRKVGFFRRDLSNLPLERLKWTTDRLGRFRYQAAVSWSEHRTCPNGLIEYGEYYGSTIFVLRAESCDDREVKYENGWHDQVIEMSCNRSP